ncbi:MAG: hypothetical protein VB102_03385 [Paludibacter sp.]|nr:hypothetical protein [Paludibacter sp.]
MNTTKQYFSIQTISGSGLGDQLGTQFSRLYALGKVLGADYVYSPVSFQRSVKPAYHTFFFRLFFRIRYCLYFCIGKNLLSMGMNVLLMKIENRISRIADKYSEKELTEFLGLKHISDVTSDLPEGFSYADPDIGSFFKENNEATLSDYKTYLAEKVKSFSADTIVQLKWTGEMWSLIPTIDKVIAEAGFALEILKNEIFSSAFRQQAHSAENKQLNVVFHIRCGDSTKITVNSQQLIVYDKFLFSSEDEMEHIFKIDPDRISKSPEEYLPVYESIKQLFNKEDAQIAVLSDGYELTYQHLLRNLLKRRCTISLDAAAKKELKIKIRDLNTAFDAFGDATLIIGETKQNLKSSIQKLAEADIVIWGCGGFAGNTHQLFRNPEKKSLVIKVSEFDESSISTIKQMKNAKSIGNHS